MRIENVLAECMDAIESGQLSVEEALERYPEMREELAPLVRAAVALQQLPRVTAPESLRREGRARLMERIGASDVEPTPIRRRPAAPGRLRPTVLLRPVAAVAAVLLVFAGTLTVSADSFPGDPLYPIKLFGEQAQLATAVSEVSRAQLHLTFAERRLAELEERRDVLTPEQVEAIIARYQREIEAAEAVARNTPEEDAIRTAVATVTARRDEVLAVVAPPQSDDNTVQPKVEESNPAPPAPAMTPVAGQDERHSAPTPSQRGAYRELPGGATLPPVVVEAGRGPSIVRPGAVPELKSLLDEARGGQRDEITEEVERYVSEVARLRKDAAHLDAGQHSAITDELTRQRREIEQVLPTLPVSSQSLLQPALAALAEADIALPASSSDSKVDRGAASRPQQARSAGSPAQEASQQPAPASSPQNGPENAVANATGNPETAQAALAPRWSPSARGGQRNVAHKDEQAVAPRPAVELAQADANADKPSKAQPPAGERDAADKPSRSVAVPLADAKKSEILGRGDKATGRQNGRGGD